MVDILKKRLHERGIAKEIKKLENITDVHDFITLLENNTSKFLYYLNKGLDEKNKEKRYFWLKLVAYPWYNLFIYTKENILTNFIIKNDYLDDLYIANKQYFSPQVFVNYICYHTTKQQKQKEIYRIFLKTEENFVEPSNINLDMSKLKEKNNKVYSLLVTVDRLENLYYRIHEIILSPEFDVLEDELKRKYSCSVLVLNKIMVEKYDIKRNMRK